MNVETVRVSSRGQLVIPQDVRDTVGVEEGTLFALACNDDTILLKKIQSPTKEQLIEDLAAFAKNGRRRLEAKGIKEEDLPSIVERRRRK